MSRASLTVCFSWFLAAAAWTQGAVFVVEDPQGGAGRVGAPVAVDVDLGDLLGDAPVPPSLYLVEVTSGRDSAGPAIAAQFDPGPRGETTGKLWWLMPPGEAGPRRFELVLDREEAAPAMIAESDESGATVDIREGPRKVLRYNHGTVPVPEGIDPEFARSGYVHPLYGPDGESLTDDYSEDHEHHRGVSWAWSRIHWKGESRDLWAVKILPGQPGGVWSRPVALHRVEGGPVWAAVAAENVWKWGDDEDPIVREEVLIRAFRQSAERRFVDFELRLTALVDEVAIQGQIPAGYGGFNLRSFPSFPEREIAVHRGPQEDDPRQAWFHLTGRFPGGTRPAGVVMFEHVRNPDYPNHPPPYDADGEPVEYPPWRTVQPAFPGERELPLPKGEPLLLEYRLWIHPESLTAAELTDAWAAYARPPRLAE